MLVTTAAMITRAWYPKRKGLNGLLLAAHLPATTADTSSHGNSINTCTVGFFSAASQCGVDCYSLTMPMGCHHRICSSSIQIHSVAGSLNWYDCPQSMVIAAGGYGSSALHRRTPRCQSWLTAKAAALDISFNSSPIIEHRSIL